MKDCFWILLTTIHLVFFSSVYGHGAFMLTKNCEKQLALGESVMNGKMKLDTTRTVTVLRNGTLLTSGSNYNPGEVLTVGVSAFSYELVIEARGGAFFKGGAACPSGGSSSRVSASETVFYGIDKSTQTAKLSLPTTGQVAITAGMASKFGDVSLTQMFVLNSST